MLGRVHICAGCREQGRVGGRRWGFADPGATLGVASHMLRLVYSCVFIPRGWLDVCVLGCVCWECVCWGGGGGVGCVFGVCDDECW